MRLRSRFLVVFAVLYLLQFAFGCASTADPEVVRLLDEACETYQTNRQTVVEFRAFAIANKDKVPAALWAKLVEFDAEVLPVVDKIGKSACTYAEIAHTISRTDATRWRDIVKVVVEAAALGKQAGLY